MVTQAVRVLAAAGVEDGAATLGPLLTAALDRALHEGEAGLTGPVSRGDAGTVAAHLEALGSLRDGEGQSLDDVVASYRRLAVATTDRCESTGRINAEQARRLREILAPEQLEG